MSHWAKHDAYAEEPRDDEYTDYSFFAPRRIMILEAKREAEYFEVPVGKIGVTYSIKSLCRGNPDLKKALYQVAGYCQSRGVPIGAFSNGHQIVAFSGNHVSVIGMGYPAPRATFRWCTSRMKINPSNTFIRNVVRDSGEGDPGVGHAQGGKPTAGAEYGGARETPRARAADA